MAKANIGNWLSRLSPEEREAHFKKVHEKRNEYFKNRRHKQITLTQEAMALLPEIVAQKILEDAVDDSWEPPREVIEKIRVLTDKGYTLEEMRAGHFKSVTNTVWDKIVRGLFKDHVPMIESLGLDLVTSRKKALRMLRRRAGMIRSQMKLYKAKDKFIPPALFRELSHVEDRLHDVEIELAQVLTKIGVVGDKNKQGTINLHIHTPRPKAAEAIDVTPEKK